jgi:hypothetical protein
MNDRATNPAEQHPASPLPDDPALRELKAAFPDVATDILVAALESHLAWKQSTGRSDPASPTAPIGSSTYGHLRADQTTAQDLR